MGSAEQLTAAAPAPHREPPPARQLPLAAAWAVVVISTLARAALVVVIALALWALAPTAIGMTSTTVMSGSMMPAIRVGDQVVTRPVRAAELSIGQVVLVADPDHPGRLRLHRFIAVRHGDMVLRGDANAQADSTPVQASALRGVAFLRIPGAGLPLFWARTGQWGAVVAFVGGVGVLILLARSRRLLAPMKRHVAVARRTTVGVAFIASAALIATTTVTDVRPAYSAFSAATATSTSSFATGTFPCLVKSAPAGLSTQPSVYYSFAEPTGTTTANLAGSGNNGVFTGSVDHVTGSCGTNVSPAVTVGASAAGCITVPTALTSPSVFTLAIWFKASTGGGLIAGFGSAGDGTASPTFDRQLIMNANGSLTFRVLTALGGSTTITASSNYADGQWHEAVASLTSLGPMKLAVDGTVVASAALSLSLTYYTGYWRFGYDAIPGSTTAYFQGQLDEAEIWNTVSLGSLDLGTLLTAGH